MADEREPLTHMQVMEHLSSILQSCEAPGAILKFQSTRPLAEQHRTPVTFLLSIGMREPKCLILYRAMMAMCGNGSSKVINVRVRPVKTERQPLLKILRERYPPMAWAEEDKKKGGGTGSGHQ